MAQSMNYPAEGKDIRRFNIVESYGLSCFMMALNISLVAVLTGFLPIDSTGAIAGLFGLIIILSGWFLPMWLRVLDIHFAFPGLFPKARIIVTLAVYPILMVLAATLSLGSTSFFAMQNIAIIVIALILPLLDFAFFLGKRRKQDDAFVPGRYEIGLEIDFLRQLAVHAKGRDDIRLLVEEGQLKAVGGDGEEVSLWPNAQAFAAMLGEREAAAFVDSFNKAISGSGLHAADDWTVAFLGPADLISRASYRHLLNYLFFFAFFVSCGLSCYYFSLGLYTALLPLLNSAFLFAFFDGRYISRYGKGSFCSSLLPRWFRIALEGVIGMLIYLFAMSALTWVHGLSIAIVLCCLSIIPLGIGIAGFFLIRKKASKVLLASGVC